MFSTPTGVEFNCSELTQLLKGHAMQISMAGKGGWRDNRFYLGL